MSYAATEWAWKQGVPYKTKIVLLAIADYHNDNTGEAFPKIPALARKCGASRWTVMQALTDLEVLGLLVVDRGKNVRGQQRRNQYRLVMTPSSQQLPTELPTATRPSSQQLPTELPAATRHKVEPVTKNRSLKNRSLGTGHFNSQPARLTGSAVSTAGDVPFPEELSVVPHTDDERLQELIEIYVVWREPPLQPLHGPKLDDHILEAWAAVRGYGDLPDDLAELYPRVLQLYIRTAQHHSFASSLRRVHHWEEELEADPAGAWEDIPIPRYAVAGGL